MISSIVRSPLIAGQGPIVASSWATSLAIIFRQGSRGFKEEIGLKHGPLFWLIGERRRKNEKN